MTLEKKIKLEADEKSQVYYDDRKYVAHTQFSDGAKWMLSELKPVITELGNALESISGIEAWIQDDKMKLLFQTKVYNAISKYNELFKK